MIRRSLGLQLIAQRGTSGGDGRGQSQLSSSAPEPWHRWVIWALEPLPPPLGLGPRRKPGSHYQQQLLPGLRPLVMGTRTCI
jgi:hypothetical protein